MRGNFLYEFSEAWAIFRSDVGWERAGSRFADLPPALIGLDELQLAIPGRVGLHQSPPPLHQPGPVCSKLGLPVEHFAANGKTIS